MIARAAHHRGEKLTGQTLTDMLEEETDNSKEMEDEL